MLALPGCIIALSLLVAPLICILHCQLVGAHAVSHHSDHHHNHAATKLSAQLDPSAVFFCNDLSTPAPTTEAAPLLPPAISPLVLVLIPLLAACPWRALRWSHIAHCRPAQADIAPLERPPLLLPC